MCFRLNCDSPRHTQKVIVISFQSAKALFLDFTVNSGIDHIDHVLFFCRSGLCTIKQGKLRMKNRGKVGGFESYSCSNETTTNSLSCSLSLYHITAKARRSTGLGTVIITNPSHEAMVIDCARWMTRPLGRRVAVIMALH